MSDIIPQKRCAKCENEFPATKEFFHADKSKPDGFVTQCKKCKIAYVKQYAQDNKESVNAYQKEYRAIHRDQEYKEYVSRYYRNNRERFRGYSKERYLVNRDSKIAYQRHYSRTHVDQIKESHKKYHSAHLAEHRIRSRQRRARMRNVQGSHTIQDVHNQHVRQRGRCYYCGKRVGKKYHVDHIIPITRVDSSNNPDNLVIACQSCNCSKGNKLPHEWPEGGRLL